MNMQRIIKSTNLISDIEKIVAEIKHDKLFVLTDEHTANLCLPLLDPWIAVKDVSRVVIPANDTNKTLENLA
ncbi:MAG TPA: 3-dehydroquinate synthase, partial [Porphyromonadaceae bacterium]|nr:3-dehydroquinate synthase [Porphyromonadaceae bacterium]